MMGEYLWVCTVCGEDEACTLPMGDKKPTKCFTSDWKLFQAVNQKGA